MLVAPRAVPGADNAAADDNCGRSELRERSELTPWDQNESDGEKQKGPRSLMIAPVLEPKSTSTTKNSKKKKSKKAKRPRKRLLVCTSFSAGPVCRAVVDAAPRWRFSDSKADVPRPTSSGVPRRKS